MNAGARHRRHDEGVALLLTLLFVVLLTVLVVEFVYETQVETGIVAANLNDFEALNAATSAVNTGMSLLIADMLTLPGQSPAGGMGGGQSSGGLTSSGGQGMSGGATYDSLDEPWALGVPFQPVNNAVMECSISDEFGKLNLNALFERRLVSAQPNNGQQDALSDQTSDGTGLSGETETITVDQNLEQTLRYLFQERGADDGVVDAILDWLDPDDDARPNGAESAYYQSLSIPYSCKNGPMSSIEELLLIRGITPEIYFGDPQQDQLPLSELLTVNGDRNGRINLNTAPHELLLALGESIGMPGLADIAVQDRETSPFVSIQDIQSRGLVPNQPQNNQSGVNARTQPFIVASNCFRLRGTGLAGEGRVRVEAVVWRDLLAGPEGFRIIQWRELR